MQAKNQWVLFFSVLSLSVIAFGDDHSALVNPSSTSVNKVRNEFQEMKRNLQRYEAGVGSQDLSRALQNFKDLLKPSAKETELVTLANNSTWSCDAHDVAPGKENLKLGISEKDSTCGELSVSCEKADRKYSCKLSCSGISVLSLEGESAKEFYLATRVRPAKKQGKGRIYSHSQVFEDGDETVRVCRMDVIMEVAGK